MEVYCHHIFQRERVVGVGSDHSVISHLRACRQHSSEVSENGMIELDNVVGSGVRACYKVRDRVLPEPRGKNKRVVAATPG